MSGIVSRLCAEVALPRMLAVRQIFDRTHIEPDAVAAAAAASLARPELGAVVKPGTRVAITCGSRGVANIARITRALADFVKAHGGKPFIVPAMGSHGGATAEGQRALLAGYGVTEAAVGCPIVSSMETVEIGQSLGPIPGGGVVTVRIDRAAAEADGIIVAGRVKPHTDFRGPYESGLMKMMAIGLGKREGAEICHQLGFGHMAEMVPLFGRTILARAPVILGFAILENAYGETLRFAALRPDEIAAREPALLEEARSHLPRIFFDEADALVVDRIGKDISGDGMDPNVTGTSHCSPYVTGGLRAGRVVVLDLTAETHGAAMGIGAAHVTTRRLLDKIDFDATYVNALTSRGIEFVSVPAVADNDREAIQLALRTAFVTGAPRIIRIPDSQHTELIHVSEALEDEARANPRLEVLSGPADWEFDPRGNLW